MNPWLFPGILIFMAIAGILLEILVVIRTNRPKLQPYGHEQRVPATIASLREAKNTGQNHWYITATWSDIQANKTYTFQSGPLTRVPPWQVGETVIVAFDPRNPQRFRIE
ncbi:MAG: DUF3592 domain-containing protein [Ktedonobacteraceae bacterium]|nr:DUF3592 domain-containing protein [Ktedonobacteraceae bacterium]